MNISENKLEKIQQSEYTFSSYDINKFSEMKQIFQKYGLIIIKNIINESFIENILECAIHQYRQTGRKIGLDNKDGSTLEILDYYVEELENKDRIAAKQAQGLISKSIPMSQLSTNKSIIEIISKLLDIETKEIILESSGGFVPNIPNNKSRLYTYHSEEHWLPYRKKFINIWAPLFRTKKSTDGTMYVKPYSHLDNHEFQEYRGFDQNYDDMYYMQYEVPENQKYFEMALEVEPKDAVFFHSNLLHKSELNASNKIGYLFIDRYFDLKNDLTISSQLGLRPYSSEAEKIGRKIYF
jgi:hypothetical protein